MVIQKLPPLFFHSSREEVIGDKLLKFKLCTFQRILTNTIGFNIRDLFLRKNKGKRFRAVPDGSIHSPLQPAIVAPARKGY
jgi:hypothetical protein